MIDEMYSLHIRETSVMWAIIQEISKLQPYLKSTEIYRQAYYIVYDALCEEALADDFWEVLIRRARHVHSLLDIEPSVSNTRTISIEKNVYEKVTESFGLGAGVKRIRTSYVCMLCLYNYMVGLKNNKNTPEYAMKLGEFCELFSADTVVKITSENNICYEGVITAMPEKLNNCRILKGSVRMENGCMAVKVEEKN